MSLLISFHCTLRYLSSQSEVDLEMKSGFNENMSEEEIIWDRLVANPIHVFKLIQRSEGFINDCVPQFEQSFCKYRRPSLFADFLSANLFIHNGKIGLKCRLAIQKGLLFCEFIFVVQNVSSANNEGNL